MSDTSLMDALGGNMTADEWLQMQQEASLPQTNRQQFMGNPYIQSYAQDYYGNMPGGTVRSYNQPDDLLAGAKFNYGIDQDTLDRQTKQQATQFTQGLQGQAAQQDTTKFQSQFSDPESDLLFLNQQGVPDEVLAALTDPSQQANFAPTLDRIAPLIPGMVDPDTGESTWHTTAGQQRMMAIIHAAASKVGQGQGPEDVATQSARDRWSALNPNMRAQEIVQRHNNPMANTVVAPITNQLTKANTYSGQRGVEFGGPNAEQRAQDYMHPMLMTQKTDTVTTPPSNNQKPRNIEKVGQATVDVSKVGNRALWEAGKFASGYDLGKWLLSR